MAGSCEAGAVKRALGWAAGVSDDGEAGDDWSDDGPVTPPIPPWSLDTSLFLMSAAEARVPATPSVKVA